MIIFIIEVNILSFAAINCVINIITLLSDLGYVIDKTPMDISIIESTIEQHIITIEDDGNDKHSTDDNTKVMHSYVIILTHCITLSTFITQLKYDLG